MKQHSKTFSYAFDFLEYRKRKAVWSIYAVCRIVDDSIDEYNDLNRLQNIENDLKRIYLAQSQGGQIQSYESDTAIMNAFKNTLDHFAIPHEPLRTLIQYVKADLTLSRITTDEALSDYCYGVAGAVGELLTPIFTADQQYSDDKAVDTAIALGKALQLTNILRDVGEDFQNDRIYLSEDRLNRYDVNLAKLYMSGITQNYINLWESYAQMAEQFYQKVLYGVMYFDKDVQYIIELAAQSYREILGEIRNANYTLHQKIYVSKYRKMKIYRTVISKYNRSESL